LFDFFGLRRVQQPVAQDFLIGKLYIKIHCRRLYEGSASFWRINFAAPAAPNALTRPVASPINLQELLFNQRPAVPNSAGPAGCGAFLM